MYTVHCMYSLQATPMRHPVCVTQIYDTVIINRTTTENCGIKKSVVCYQLLFAVFKQCSFRLTADICCFLTVLFQANS